MTAALAVKSDFTAMSSFAPLSMTKTSPCFRSRTRNASGVDVEGVYHHHQLVGQHHLDEVMESLPVPVVMV